MSKNETIFIRFLILLHLFTRLYGDSTVGVLTSIKNNGELKLLDNNRAVLCEPFGIIPLERMAKNSVTPTECQNHIDAFYRSHPHDKYFAQSSLHIYQSYHYERIQEGCILYGNGLESYSEMLLEKGLALIDPKFDQKEWNWKLKQAQRRAESGKIGLHNTLIQTFCIYKSQ
ncbi:MAG: hypothetical protein PHW64_03135 [Sulfuricurvum sp.]|nr:hypothetical protein [Sulfuricurvum sp.]